MKVVIGHFLGVKFSSSKVSDRANCPLQLLVSAGYLVVIGTGLSCHGELIRRRKWVIILSASDCNNGSATI